MSVESSVRAALYARVSTTDQNCELQVRELREYCQRRGWTIVAEYVDNGVSGTKASRPELDRLMADARRRKVDVICTWKLDRWARSLAHLVQSIQELDSLGVRFVAITQNIDTDASNPMAKLLMHLMGAFAEFERSLIVERTVAGVRAARSKGKTIGRPRRVFRRDEAIRLRTEGWSWRKIAAELGVPVMTVRDACTESLSTAREIQDENNTTFPMPIGRTTSERLPSTGGPTMTRRSELAVIVAYLAFLIGAGLVQFAPTPAPTFIAQGASHR
jgi:DNA invertase Pin-like site-specific DNA recombinase